MKITKNIQPCRLLSWCDLTKKERQEFDWLETEEEQSASNFFRSKGQVYCLDEFIRTDPHGQFSEWDGLHSTSAFSAVLIKLIHGIDGGVIVGYCYS